MELNVLNIQGQTAATLTVADSLFGKEYNEALVHQLVVAYQANARSGNRAQKGRSEVQKSTKKPWRQKGTGRARAGMASSPVWRGGGKIFPSSPDENFTHKVNRKMYRAGVATIYSELVRQDRLVVIEDLAPTTPKTKDFAGTLKTLGLDNVLIIVDEIGENLFLSSRNLPHVLVLETSQVDPVSLIRHDRVLITRAAVQKIEELLA